jgi:hypothetical protein
MLDILYGVLGISKLNVWIQNINFFTAEHFLNFLVIKTIDLHLRIDTTRIRNTPGPDNICKVQWLLPTSSGLY